MSALCLARATTVDHIVPLSRWGGWVNGSTSAWRRVRLAVLIRDGHRCQLPVDAAGDYDRAADGDWSALVLTLTGPHDPSNLRAACTRHNSQRGDGTDKRRWPRRTRWEW